MHGSAAEPEFVDPTRSDRIKALAVYAIAGLLCLFFPAAWKALVQPNLEGSFCETLPWLQGAAAFYLVSFLLAAAVLARMSYLIFRSGQVPVPGAWLLFRQRIRRGWSASLDGMLAAAMALCMVGLVAVCWVHFDLGLVFCLTEPCGC